MSDTDVFGRPLNLQSAHANQHTLAPDPLNPSPQTMPFSGARQPNEPSAPGVGADFSGSVSESVGAQQRITGTQPQGRPDPTTEPTMWHGNPGGYTLPAATPRTEESVGTPDFPQPPSL